MSDQVYDWKRFWCPRSGQFDLSDRGYLTDPDSDWGKSQNSSLISFESLVETQCLVLLGEPGSGKSRELRNLRDYTQSVLHETNKPLFLDLKAYGSETQFIQNLFESKRFTDWLYGTYHLHIFLDSLDEGLLKIDTLASLIIEELSKEEYSDHLSRLYFRITCRTAVFPRGLEEGLNQLWQNNVQSYELVPLRRVDVKLAANNSELDAESFLQAIEQKGIVPFAIKPITLEFLISIFKRNNGQFPQKLTDLYLEGCRLLCEEQKDQNYHPSRKVSKLSIEQRLIVAARIAAITVFARKSAIWIGGVGDSPEENIFLERLCIGCESVNHRTLEVDSDVVREVLDTGLFSSRGANQNRIGFAHQSYAEFLAAWYLKQRNLHLDQVLSLIYLLDQRVIPQLHETATWLASLDPQFFQRIMATDPDVVLQSEILADNDGERETVLCSLLESYDQGKLAYQTDVLELSPYKRWNHANLPSQLRTYICDSTKSEASRYVAIDIAEACHVKAIRDYLADVALDSQQSYWMRVRAVKAVKRLGNEDTKLRLKPLAISQSEDDLEDELKGYALRSLYPQYLTTKEVLDNITQPRSKIIGGTYQDFLAKEFTESLQVSDLPIALTYLENQPVLYGSHYPFNAMSDRILLKAWEHLDIREVLEPFAKVVLLRIRAHQQVIDSITGIDFIDLLAENDTKRRRLLETIINLSGDWEEPPYYLAGTSFYSRVSPLTQDFLWLIEKIQDSNSESVQRTYSWLVSLKLDWTDADQVSAVITASESLPILKAEFASFLGQIEIASSEAETARAHYLRTMQERRSWQDKEDEEIAIQPSPKERVLIYLEQFELGQVAAWWHLCREMTLMPKSRHYGNEFKADLTMLPGWKEADDLTQTRIISAAKRYIYDGEPETDAWFGTTAFRSSALAGYKALRLVIEKDLQYILNISSDIWKKWTAIILDYPDPSDTSNEKHREHLLSLAYKNAPDEFIARLMILLDQDNAQYGDIHIFSQIECCWDEKLEIALCEKLHDEKLTDKSIGALLKLLMKRQVKSAKAFAQAKISIPLPSTGKAREIEIVSAQMLMLYGDDESWEIVWNASQHDLEYRKKVLEAVSFANRYQGDIEYRIHEDYIADLYLFLVEHYPDPPKSRETLQSEEFNLDTYRTDAEDSIRRWKNQILYRLEQRGTRGACEALRKIIHYLPEQKDQLQWRLPEAEASARRKDWQPPKPDDILQLLTIQEPSALESYNRLVQIDQRTQKMAEEPKIDQSIHVTHSQVSGGVGNGREYKTDPLPKKGVNWIAWISIPLTIATLLVSGLFNNEIRRFLKLDPTPPVEQKQEKSIK